MDENADLPVEEQVRAVTNELDRLAETYGADRSAWPDGQVTYANRLDNALRKIEAKLTVEVSRAQRAEAIRAAELNPALRENGFGAGHGPAGKTRKADPWRGLGVDVARADSFDGLSTRALDVVELLDESVPDAGRERITRMLEQDKSLDTAAFVIAASDPAYVRAFVKVLTSEHGHRMWTPEEQQAYARVESVRSAMSEGASGTYLVPIPLDPSIVLTNTGAINPIRDISRIETTASATWTGVASAGATAYWVGENTALTEGSGTFSRVSVTPAKLAAYLTASYEIFQDTTIMAQLPTLIGDAFARAEAAAFITGSGSGAPLGIVTAISGTAGSTVTATTRGSFTSGSVVDVYNVDNALPARARAAKPKWIANRTIINTIRQMAATNYGSSFWANLAQDTPASLLDHEMFEASAMTTATTSGSVSLILGDFSQFLIVDRIGTQIEYVQNVVDANGVPTGTRGWIAWKRTSAQVTNVDGFRFLLC